MNQAKSTSAVIRLSLAVFLALAFLCTGLSVLTARSGAQPAANSVQALAPAQAGIVISQVYGGGGIAALSSRTISLSFSTGDRRRLM